MPSAHLPDRGAILVSGEDAFGFLQGLVTGNVETLEPGGARLAALLTPQGKILFDFLMIDARKSADALPGIDGYLLDCARGIMPDLIKRLGFYKLRAKVQVAEAANVDGPLAVIASWGTDALPLPGALTVHDGRHPGLGERQYVRVSDARLATASAAAYATHRIGLGIPEGGKDFAFGEAFPHDVDMDQLGGVDFAKGCYIGQEVVSRMEHRGTARRRIVIAHGAPLPATGTAILAGEIPIGSLGSTAGDSGLALIRLDRAKEAMDAGRPITAGGTAISLTVPDWARFGWPAAVAADA